MKVYYNMPKDMKNKIYPFIDYVTMASKIKF